MNSRSSKNIVLNSVGVEFEVYQRERVVRNKLLGYAQMDVTFVNDGLTLTHTNEYYEYQHEIIARPFENSEENYDKFRKFVNDTVNSVKGRNNMSGLVCPNREYVPVGTHLHYFFSRNGVPFGGKKDVKMRVTDFALTEIVGFLADFATKSKEDGYKYYGVLLTEVNRLVRSHCILRYFDMERLKDSHRRNLEDSGFRYMSFHSGTERKKYAPVIWSHPTESGKKMSLEVRLIPNSMMGILEGDYWVSFSERVKELVISTPDNLEEDNALHARRIEAALWFLTRAMAMDNEGGMEDFHNALIALPKLLQHIN